ncbi:MAG TPA: NB-ARC domain-containing protein [Kribbellaceae bacterium]|nr:NB-ARC domain-containing protein [Kribbellaceae bacterium]
MRTTWWQRFVAGVVLVLLGICAVGAGSVALYLERRGLDDADKIASVGGFFLAGIGTVLAIVSVVQGLVLAGGRTAPVPADLAPARSTGVSPTPVVEAPPLVADVVRLRDITNVDHERLFGVDSVLGSLAESLGNRDAAWIISIFGGAGVGKTALAYELVRQHAAAAGFRRVVSVSAKFSHMDRVGHVERDHERENTDWRDLLVELAQQLAPDLDFNDGLIDRQLPAAMPTEPCLIVVDNLETREAELAVRYLADARILRPHKAVITTREAVGSTGLHGLREVTWDGPDKDSAAEYARYLAVDDPTLDPRKRDLDDVVEAAERNPLLIQIIVNQARVERLPIREVIDRLRDINGVLGRAVWDYCYVSSLNVLERKLRDAGVDPGSAADLVADLMSVFCFRPAGTSITAGEFFQLSEIADYDAFLRVRAMACNLALVKSLSGNTRFTVHSLLREFYCSQSGQA